MVTPDEAADWQPLIQALQSIWGNVADACEQQDNDSDEFMAWLWEAAQALAPIDHNCGVLLRELEPVMSAYFAGRGRRH